MGNRKIEIPAANGGKNCEGLSSRSELCTLTGAQTDRCKKIRIKELLSQDEDGKTKLYLAAKENRIEEAKKMMKEANNLNIVSELVNKGSNSGVTPLLRTSENGHHQMAKLLLNNGAEVDKANNLGETPLIWASFDGHLEIVKLLINKGAEIDKANNGGWTPLISASYFGYLEVVNLLIEHQADVQLKTNVGKTALDWARERGKTAVEKALLEAGAT